jgi:predicted methyltransferase
MKHLWMGAAMAAMLVACGPDERPDEVDEAMERGEQLMREAGEALEEFGEDAREAGGRVLDEAREALDDDRDPADETAEEPVRASGADRSLQEIIDDPARTEDAARDQFRNPRQTLEFFGIEPGDTVVEALPGGGWYTRILLPYLGEEGRYHAVNYPMPVFEQIFADRLTDERRAELADWENTFPGQAAAWGGDVDGAFRFGAVPAELEGGADAVLYIRALHNLARFNMLDMADFVVLNKFEKKGSLDALRDIRKQMQRNRGEWDADPATMPVFKGLLKDKEVDALIAYLKSVK